MKRHVSGKDLKSWIHNYTHNKDLPLYTNWGVVMMSQILPFLQEAEAKGADAVAIAMIRFPCDEDGPESPGTENPRIKTAGLGLSQVSFAVIPGNSKVEEPWAMTALKTEGLYNIISICEPGKTLIEDPTGLCPPQGDEIKIDDPD